MKRLAIMLAIGLGFIAFESGAQTVVVTRNHAFMPPPVRVIVTPPGKRVIAVPPPAVVRYSPVVMYRPVPIHRPAAPKVIVQRTIVYR
ncbi:MAG TPA: hypothetical protein VGD22_15125 [Sphingobacteriaceae bacterium]